MFGNFKGFETGVSDFMSFVKRGSWSESYLFKVGRGLVFDEGNVLIFGSLSRSCPSVLFASSSFWTETGILHKSLPLLPKEAAFISSGASSVSSLLLAASTSLIQLAILSLLSQKVVLTTSAAELLRFACSSNRTSAFFFSVNCSSVFLFPSFSSSILFTCVLHFNEQGCAAFLFFCSSSSVFTTCGELDFFRQSAVCVESEIASHLFGKWLRESGKSFSLGIWTVILQAAAVFDFEAFVFLVVLGEWNFSSCSMMNCFLSLTNLLSSLSFISSIMWVVFSAKLCLFTYDCLIMAAPVRLFIKCLAADTAFSKDLALTTFLSMMPQPTIAVVK